MNSYFTTIYSNAYEGWLSPRSLPLAYYLTYIGNVLSGEFSYKTAVDHFVGYFLPGMIIGGVFFGLAWFAFLKRPREAAGKGLCFSFVESFVKVTTAVCAGIFTGLLADAMLHATFTFSVIAFLEVLCSVAVICLIAEWVYSLNVTAALHRGWQIPVCFLLSALWLGAFKSDAFGFDSYIPAEEDVESCAIFQKDEWYNYHYFDNDDGDYADFQESSEDYFEKRLIIEGVDAVRQLAQVGMPAQKERGKRMAEWDYEENGENGPKDIDKGWNTAVLYRMKSGAKVWRTIWIPNDIDEAMMDRIIGEESYRKQFFNTEGTLKVLKDWTAESGENRLSIEYDTIITSESEKVMYPDVEKLIAAYEKDLAQYDFSFIQSHLCLGTFSVMYRGTDGSEIGEYYPVYEGFDHTIRELEALEVYHEPLPKQKDVGVAAVQQTEYDENGIEIRSEEKEYTSPEQIAALMEAVDISYNGDWTKTKDYEGSLFVRLVEKDELAAYQKLPKEESLFDSGIGTDYTLLRKDQPDFVKKDFPKGK